MPGSDEKNKKEKLDCKLFIKFKNQVLVYNRFEYWDLSIGI